MRGPEPQPGQDAPTGPRALSWRGIALIGLVAYLLRAWTLGDGLPDFLDEAWPFREAFDMWGWSAGGTDLNPHRFHYPSLTFYLQFAVQKLHYLWGTVSGVFDNPADYWLAFHTDPTPMAIGARLLGIGFDVTSVCLVAWLAERLQKGAGLLAGLILAASATMLGAARGIFTDTYMMTLALAALVTMVRHRETGGRGWLAATVALVGLATGAKYPAATLLVPLGWILWRRHGRRALPLWLASAFGAFVVFLVTTPFAVLDPVTFWRDLSFVRLVPAAGHLGRLEGTGLAYHAHNLLREVGILGLALVPVSLALTATRWRERADQVALWLALLAFGLPVFLARVEAARYLVAVIPLIVLLAAVTGVEIASRLERRRRLALVVVWVGLLAPALLTGLEFVMRGSVSTQVQARRWFEENLGPEVLIVQESWGAPLLTRAQTLEVQASPLFEQAREQVRARYLARPWFRSVQLPLTTVGPGTVTVPTDRGDVEFQVVRHAADFNALAYDPRLFAEADYFVTSSAVRGRFEADTARFAAPVRLYALLDRDGQVSVRFVPDADTPGPEIVVYRLGEAARRALRAGGPVDPLWWTEIILPEARREIEARLVPERLRTDGAPRGPGGEPAAWLRPLGRMYVALIRRFAHPMSVYLLELGRNEAAMPLALATLAMAPGDAEACLVFTTAAAELERWNEGLAVLDRTTRARGGAPAMLELERVRLLLGAGRVADARAALVTLSDSLPPGDPLAGEIAELLEAVGSDASP